MIIEHVSSRSVNVSEIRWNCIFINFYEGEAFFENEHIMLYSEKRELQTKINSV